MKQQESKIRSRIWLCTLNNPLESLADLYEVFKPKYMCGQVEKGESGTIHLQFFLHFKESVWFSTLKKLHSKVHFVQVKQNNGADTYCMKEESRLDGPYEFGENPSSVILKLIGIQFFLMQNVVILIISLLILRLGVIRI